LTNYSLNDLARAIEPRQMLVRAFFSIGPKDGATELLLIRHAQIPETRTYDEDPPLTELGRAQAEALGNHLAKTPIVALYASPAVRARETAAAIGKHHGLEAAVRDDLRDVEFYLPPGQTIRDVVGEEEYEKMLQRFAREKVYTIYGETRESAEQMRERMTQVLDEIIASNPPGRIAVVSHGPPIQAYLAGLLGSRYDMMMATRLTAVSVVWAKGELRDVQTVNSTAHFGGY
jgi:broad specificity phosphatase PhoE